jgi:hypothetical protein
MKPLTFKGLPIIECSVTFLSSADGGRSAPLKNGALSEDSYRPLIVIGDPSQRESLRDGNRLTEEHIGVTFHSGPEEVKIDEELRVELLLMFYPHPAYNKLQSGATFTVREGPHIVAYGLVLQGL